HQILFHDTYAKDYEFVASGVDGGFWAGTASPYWTGYTGNYVQNTNNDAIQMDWNQYAPGSLLNRYLVPKVFAKGDSLTGNAQVYLSFYDANEGALIFRNFQIGQTASPNRRGMNDAGQSNLSERTNVASGDPSRWSVTTSANNHFDMVVTDNDEVVFIYYNQAAGKIELVYTSTAAGNTTPASVTGADPRTTVNFSAVTQINQSFTGTYLSATIETDGVGGTPDPIHIAAHDSANGDLIYIKLDSLTDTTPEIVTVDQHLSVGILTDIEVNDSGVPYITYYNNSENGTKDSVKLAWYKGNPSEAIAPGVNGLGNVTGDWEAMTIPVIDTPNGGIVQFQRVNLDFEDLDNAGAGINLSPVVGYLADDIEYAKILPELP
ncbi:MAG: hypothetical protein KAU31_11355, partial [Spirochaetaceae bacterium]|nr:hypothetical protein [Spirochaetaceae bacterium]